MILAEKRLQTSILRRNILKELNFLLENYHLLKEFDPIDMPPGGMPLPSDTAGSYSNRIQPTIDAQAAIGRAAGEGIVTVGKGIVSGLSTVGNNFYEAWRELKSGYRDPSLFVKATKLAVNDLVILAQKDPLALVCLVLDLISIVDPTGIADIIQGGILIARGSAEGDGLAIFFGVVSLIFGFLTAASFLAAIGTGGAAAPIFIAVKAGKIAARNLTLKGIVKICEIIATYGIKFITFLRKSKWIREGVFPIVENFVEKARLVLASPGRFNNVDDILHYLTGAGKKAEEAISPLTTASKKAMAQGAVQTMAATGQVAASVVRGAQIREESEPHEIVRKQFCNPKRWEIPDGVNPTNYQQMVAAEQKYLCEDILAYNDSFGNMKVRSKSNNKRLLDNWNIMAQETKKHGTLPELFSKNIYDEDNLEDEI